MSWNQNANIIFLESPICVGYSYQDDHGSCLMSDNTKADDNYNEMLQFLDKFPVYKDSDFYITGESYGGVYVPSLALRTMQGMQMRMVKAIPSSISKHLQWEMA
eukprot:362776_1